MRAFAVAGAIEIRSGSIVAKACCMVATMTRARHAGHYNVLAVAALTVAHMLAPLMLARDFAAW